MSSVDQLQYLSWLLYVVLFVLVLVRTIRLPTPAHIHMTLFFGAVALVILSSSLASTFHASPPGWLVNLITPIALLALGYLLLRLVRDFTDVPRLLVRAVELGMLASIAAVVFVPMPLPVSVVLALVGYLVLVIGYDAWAFARQAARTQGVTRRRMQAVSLASLSVVAALITAGLGVLAPDAAGFWAELGAIFGLSSGVCYFIGFAPPTWLRRAWQEPEVRAFLSRAAHLAGSTAGPTDILAQLERGAADAFGAPAARIALWDPESRRLRIATAGDAELPARLARAWTQQRASLVTELDESEAHAASLTGVAEARAALFAPITAYDKRMGVLVVFAQRAPVFANSDLELIELLADEAAVTLESRALMQEAARIHAREEAARLKEDFLSSAAHDLKTPLTGIVTQAQILQRKTERDPAAPADRVGLVRLVDQSQRLKRLVLELLDASRLEQGSLVADCEPLDLTGLCHTLARQEATRWQRVHLDAREPVVAEVDPPRIGQVITNLVENALKYSPPPTPVALSVWRHDGEARLSVRDQGIGIPAEEQHVVFERFHRGGNVDDRRFAGMGLGLYIARAIVEQHGGRIWVDSAPGEGSTFHVALPLGDLEREPPTGVSEAMGG